MARSNREVQALLQEYADLIAITGGDSFKARAYEKAARAIGDHPQDISTLDVKGLQRIPGVGRSIAEKVAEYRRSGSVADIEEVRAKVPAGLRELIAIPTLGPRKAKQLHDELGISSVDELAQAIQEHRLRDLKGFGPRSEENFRHGIELMSAAGGRVPVHVAMDLAEDVVATLSRVAGCEKCTWAGSLRRMKETVGDIDVLAASRSPGRLMRTFTSLPYVTEVVASGETKATVRTSRADLQVDLRVLHPDSWGAGLLYFVGSKAHNIRVRELALRHGYKLSEYGLFEAGSGRRIASRTEEDVYARLGLPWIPPTLREDRGEVERALEDDLPQVVTDRDIRGDLHTHTDLTDGLGSLADMVDAAAERGYAYYAVTDHAPNLFMQRMTDEKMLAQRERLHRLQNRHKGLRLLHGTELNIGPDGEVDWPATFLEGFDVCVASVHSHFRQSRAAMTRRLVRACENPYVNIIGHPTGRKIGKREGLDADLDEVFAACARTGTALEINAHPDRLDLSDEHILHARRHGVRFAVNSDAHSVLNLAAMRYGVATAQRGWLTPDDVINTWSLRRLREFVQRKRTAQPA